jgi:uncharacterized OB-fold protein
MTTDSIDWDHVVTAGRIQPAMTGDTEFFWAGMTGHRLLIQRCTSCGTLRHPPGPMCANCRSLEWDSVESRGTGRIYSYTVVHKPMAPGFTQPALVGLIELEEGTRLVTNLVGFSPDDVQIGQAVEVFFADQAEGWAVAQFRPAAR